MKSPLEDVRHLLKGYAFIGLFPADINHDATRVEYRPLLYLPLLLVVSLFAMSSVIMLTISALDGTCFFPMAMENLTEDSDMTLLETIINNLDGMAKVIFVLTSIWFGRPCIKKYAKLCELFEEQEDKAGCYWSTKDQLKNNLAIVASSLISGTLLSLATIFAYDPHWECPNSIALVFLVDFIFVYGSMATSVHEMVFCCYAHGLSKVIACSVKLLQRNEDIASFCNRQKQHFKIAKTIEDTFGLTLCNSYLFNVLLLIVSTYLCVINFMGLYWEECLPSYTSAASSLVLAASSGARILHLTNHVQRTYDAFAAALDAVDMLDGNKFDSPEARQARALLSRGDGMPLRGYFIINRAVILAILGNLLTYLIILIEFEMEDQEDDNCTCSNSTA